MDITLTNSVREWLVGADKRFIVVKSHKGLEDRATFSVGPSDDRRVWFVWGKRPGEQATYVGTLFSGKSWKPSWKCQDNSLAELFGALLDGVPNDLVVLRSRECPICRQILKDEESIRRGIGPTCGRNWTKQGDKMVASASGPTASVPIWG